MVTEPAKAGATKPPKVVAKGNPKDPQSPKPLKNAAKPANPPPGNPPSLSKPTGARSTPRPLPVKSVQRAAKAFKNFSLSRFPNAATPSNFVPHAQIRNPAAVNEVQRTSMATQVAAIAAKAAIAANPPPILGMTVALTAANLKKLLPNFAKTGEVDLTELLDVLKKKLQGTEFYASGNPTLNRVVREAALLSQVQAYIKAITAGGAGAAAPAAPPAAAPKGAALKAGAAIKKAGGA
jgi:hypothetical protein